ncbi:MAG: hypothetical protein WCH46_06320 [bacterium]
MTRISLRLLAVLIVVVCFNPLSVFAQDEATLKGTVDGLGERVSTLESTVAGMAKMKITGYVQPQWLWNDADSQANQVNSKNYFQIRRGRVKFTHTSGDISAVIYPDITENGVVIKEVYATWNALKDAGTNLLGISMGSMNRPFGYEIAYSSSAREVTERSLYENRFFNGERDLGIQLNFTPTFGSIKPLLEIGLFNGTDNFGTGPSGAVPGANNKMGFTANPIGFAAVPFATPKGADSLFQVKANSAVGKESALILSTQGGLPGGTTGTPIGQPAKELIGHLRLPFLLSDEFSFDVGASISMGGITEPSNVIGKYTGTNGALVLANTGTNAGHSFSNQNHVFMQSNRSIIGVDAQFYLSVLPFGGSIVKFEMYSGQTPFYGSAALFNSADFAALGDPLASTIYKKTSGMYVMLVQNLSDMLQIAARYETYDPNTEVKGTDFAVLNGAAVTKLRGVSASTGFGGDLAQNTISVDLNVFISGTMRLMFDFDMPTTEDFTRVDPAVATNVQTVKDAHDNRFTFRMQYKF